MVREQDVEKALDRLEAIGPKLAKAKATADFCADMLKTVYAAQFLRSLAPTMASKESEAWASPAYREALDKKAEATMAYEELRHERGFLERTIEVWQTWSANTRGRI